MVEILHYAVSFAALLLLAVIGVFFSQILTKLKNAESPSVASWHDPAERVLNVLREHAHAAISFAEEQAHKHLREHGAKMPSDDKLEAARNWLKLVVLDVVQSKELTEPIRAKLEDSLDDIIESQLGHQREFQDRIRAVRGDLPLVSEPVASVEPST